VLSGVHEEASIRRVVEEAHAIATEAGLGFELIVCDDGSRDATYAELTKVAARLPRLRCLRHSANRGIRATFEHLYSEATKDFVFLNATDGQWDTRVLVDMLPLTRDWDVIIASRRRKPYGPVRQLISWGFNAIPPLPFGVRTVDAGAVKLQRREIIERFRLVSHSPFRRWSEWCAPRVRATGTPIFRATWRNARAAASAAPTGATFSRRCWTSAACGLR
jgi:dolichol-phosphate mannosyltransferase